MSALRTFCLAVLAMTAFAANSLLCRRGLKSAGLDAASFTAIRLCSGALALYLIVRTRQGERRLAGSWPSAAALFIYAAAFSFAYARMPTATGALILFGSVQATMIGFGLLKGEKLSRWQVIGLCCALGGLINLFLPGFSAPPLGGAALMSCAGAAWGAYSLSGRAVVDPTTATTGNFVRSVPLAVVLSVVLLAETSFTISGVWCAVASGAVTSGLGYVVWYSVLPHLKATTAATIQLSVPVLAALGGSLLLSEPVTLRLLGSSVAILGGIGLIVSARQRTST